MTGVLRRERSGMFKTPDTEGEGSVKKDRDGSGATTNQGRLRTAGNHGATRASGN